MRRAREPLAHLFRLGVSAYRLGTGRANRAGGGIMKVISPREESELSASKGRDKASGISANSYISGATAGKSPRIGTAHPIECAPSGIFRSGDIVAGNSGIK